MVWVLVLIAVLLAVLIWQMGAYARPDDDSCK